MSRPGTRSMGISNPARRATSSVAGPAQSTTTAASRRAAGPAGAPTAPRSPQAPPGPPGHGMGEQPADERHDVHVSLARREDHLVHVGRDAKVGLELARVLGPDDLDGIAPASHA